MTLERLASANLGMHLTLATVNDSCLHNNMVRRGIGSVCSPGTYVVGSICPNGVVCDDETLVLAF